MEISKLKRYSLGLVVDDKSDDTHWIHAIPIEWAFAEKTSIDNIVESYDLTVNVEGGQETISAKISNGIRAKWLQINGNKVLSPRVRKNEYVYLYRLGDTDIYFWEDLNISNVKRTERNIWAFNADPNNPTKDDLSNADVLEWDTEKGHITLTTATANGEPFNWVVQINKMDGYALIQASSNDVIYINAKETDIGMKNAYGSYFQINKDNMFGFAKDTIDFTSGKKISLKTKDMIVNTETLTINASNSITMTTKDYTITTDSYSLKSSTYTHMGKSVAVTADTVKYNCPSNTFSGMLTCGGLAVGGAGSGGGLGNAVVNGNMTINGNVVITESFTAKIASIETLTVTGVANIPTLNPKPKY